MPAAAQAARRALKNRALYYLGELGDGKVSADLLRRTREATNMTDHIAALAALTDHPGAPEYIYFFVPQHLTLWLQRAA